MNIDKKVVDKLEEEVRIAEILGEIPVGAVVFNENGNIISSGHNTRQSTSNVLGHAEINAILEAESKIGDWRLNGYSLLVSLEPCDMCSIIIKEVRIDNVFYFVKSNNSKQINLVNFKYIEDAYYNEYFNKILVSFFNNKRWKLLFLCYNNQQEVSYGL